MRKDTEFRCPECGSRHFGAATGVYSCHDENGCACRFRGPEKDEWKFFVGVVSFETEEEYERWRSANPDT